MSPEDLDLRSDDPDPQPDAKPSDQPDPRRGFGRIVGIALRSYFPPVTGPLPEDLDPGERAALNRIARRNKAVLMAILTACDTFSDSQGNLTDPRNELRPFSRAYLAALANVSESEAGLAIKALRAAGIITAVTWKQREGESYRQGYSFRVSLVALNQLPKVRDNVWDAVEATKPPSRRNRPNPGRPDRPGGGRQRASGPAAPRASGPAAPRASGPAGPSSPASSPASSPSSSNNRNRQRPGESAADEHPTRTHASERAGALNEREPQALEGKGRPLHDDRRPGESGLVAYLPLPVLDLWRIWQPEPATDPTARALLSIVRDYREPQTAEALARCIGRVATEPLAYLRTTLLRQTPPGLPKLSNLEWQDERERRGLPRTDGITAQIAAEVAGDLPKAQARPPVAGGRATTTTRSRSEPARSGRLRPPPRRYDSGISTAAAAAAASRGAARWRVVAWPACEACDGSGWAAGLPCLACVAGHAPPPGWHACKACNGGGGGWGADGRCEACDGAGGILDATAAAVAA